MIEVEYVGNEALKATFESVLAKGKTLENAQGALARDALAGLFSKSLVWLDVVTLALAAAGNPAKKNGDAYDTLSGVRKAKGGNALYQALNDKVLKIWEAKDVEGVSDAVTAFLLKDLAAPRGIEGLRKQVATLCKAALGDVAKPNADAEPVDDEAPAPIANAPTSTKPVFSLIEAASMIDAMSVRELIDANTDIRALHDAITNAVKRIVAEEEALRRAA